LEDRLRSFHRTVDTLSNEELVEVIEEANQVMGIKMRGDETDSNLNGLQRRHLEDRDQRAYPRTFHSY
jgi:hypothetical protein